jgi:hypothetical protein
MTGGFRVGGRPPPMVEAEDTTGSAEGLWKGRRALPMGGWQGPSGSSREAGTPMIWPRPGVRGVSRGAQIDDFTLPLVRALQIRIPGIDGTRPQACRMGFSLRSRACAAPVGKVGEHGRRRWRRRPGEPGSPAGDRRPPRPETDPEAGLSLQVMPSQAAVDRCRRPVMSPLPGPWPGVCPAQDQMMWHHPDGHAQRCGQKSSRKHINVAHASGDIADGVAPL